MTLKRLILLVVLGAGGGGVLVYTLRSQVGPANGRLVPFTAYMTMVLTDGKGGGTTYQGVSAVRSDGGHVQQNITGTPKSLSITTQVSDPTSRTLTKWNNITRKKETVPLTDDALARLRFTYQSATCSDRYNSGSGDPQFLRWDSVAGVQVAVFGKSDDKADWKFYLAPSLNCFQVKQTQDWKDTGGKTIFEVSQVVRGEPNPAFFQVPPDAVETTPSDFEHAMSQAHGFPMPESMAERMKRRDAAYLAARQNAVKLGIKLPE